MELQITRVETDWKSLFEATQREMAHLMQFHEHAVAEITGNHRDIRKLRKKVKTLQRQLTLASAPVAALPEGPPKYWVFEPEDAVLKDAAHVIQVGTRQVLLPIKDEFFTGD